MGFAVFPIRHGAFSDTITTQLGHLKFSGTVSRTRMTATVKDEGSGYTSKPNPPFPRDTFVSPLKCYGKTTFHLKRGRGGLSF